MAFDVEGALRAGYTLPEIADHLGQQKKFDVVGARQAGYSDSELVRHLMGASQGPKTGFFANLGAGYESLKGDIGSIGAGFGVPGAEAYAKKQAQLAAEKAKIPEFSEAPVEYVTSLLGRSVPYMVAPLAAAVAAPEAAALATVGRVALTAKDLAATAVSGIQFFGSNLSRQLEEGKTAKDLDLGSAASAAPFQAALDTVGFRFIPGLRKVFGEAGIKMSDDELREVMKARMTENLAGKVLSYGTKTLQTAGVEGLTETGQQVLERAQAGLNISDPAARKEYFDSFVGGAVLGGTLSVPGTAIERSSQQAQYEGLMRKDAAAAAEEKRKAGAYAGQAGVQQDLFGESTEGYKSVPTATTYTGLTNIYGQKLPDMEVPPVREAQEKEGTRQNKLFQITELRDQHDVLMREVDRLKGRYEAPGTTTEQKTAILEEANQLNEARADLEKQIKTLSKKLEGAERAGAAPEEGQQGLDFEAPLMPRQQTGEGVVLGEQAAPPAEMTPEQTEFFRQERVKSIEDRMAAGEMVTPADMAFLRMDAQEQLALLQAQPTPDLFVPEDQPDFRLGPQYLQPSVVEPAPAVETRPVTENDFKAMGIGRTNKKLREAILGMDLADPVQRAEVREVLTDFANNPNRSEKIISGVENFLSSPTFMEQGELDLRQPRKPRAKKAKEAISEQPIVEPTEPIVEPDQSGAVMADERGTPPAGGFTAFGPAGLGTPTAPAGQPDVGAPVQSTALVEGVQNEPVAPMEPVVSVAPTQEVQAPAAPEDTEFLESKDATKKLMEATGLPFSIARNLVNDKINQFDVISNTDLDALIEQSKTPAKKAKAAKPAPYTPEEREMAEAHANAIGGTVVWQKGGLALIRGYSALSGAPVYAGAKGDLRTKVDIENFTGAFISDAEKAELIKEKKKIEAADARQHSTKPYPVFTNQIVVSAGTPKELGGILKGWADLLGVKANIYVTTVEDARADKDKFTGPYRAISSAGLDPNEIGSMRRLPNGDYYISFTKSTSKTQMLETLAHELGHVHMKEKYDNASPELKNSIRKEFESWLVSQKGKTARELVDALRAKTSAKGTTVAEGKMADDLKQYWRSFDEWYADQVSRWATTDEKPISVVEKFFARLGRALRTFFGNLKNKRYLANETFVQYLNAVKDVTRADTFAPDTGEVKPMLQEALDTVSVNFKKWFGNSVVRNANGTPKVMYHGTARDIEEFRPKQAGAIFLTDDPRFAEGFTSMSEERMIRDLANDLDENPEAKRALLVPLINAAIKSKDLGTDKNSRGLVKTTKEQHIETYMGMPLYRAMNTMGIGDALREKLREDLPTRANIIPVYVSAQNPFDFDNPTHVEQLSKVIPLMGEDRADVMRGSWGAIESKRIQDGIKSAGFDGFYVQEGGRKNLAVYDSSQIKSVFNKGSFDPSDGRISYQLRSTEDNLTPAGKEAAELNERMKGAGNPTESNPDSILKKMLGVVQQPEGGPSLESRIRYEVSDARAPAVEKMQTKFNNTLVDALGNIRGDLAQIQAQEHAALAEGAMEHGGIEINKDGLAEIVDRKASMAQVFDIMTKLGDRLGSLQTAMKLGHNAFIAQRAREINVHNEKIAKDIVVAEKKGNKAAVSKLTDMLITHHVTDEEIAAGTEAMQKFPELKQAFDTFTEYKNGLIDFLVQTGRISEAKANDWKEAAGYVPWTRVEEETNLFDENPAAFKGGVISIAKLPILDRSGSSKEIANIFDNMIGLTSWAVKTGMNAYASRRMVESLPDAFELTTDDAIKYAQKYHKDRLIFTYKDGERTAYMLANPLDRGAFASNIVPLGLILKGFSFAQSTLRSFITHMPAFALSQLIQDGTYRAMLLSGVKHPFTLPAKVAKNFIHAMAGEGIPLELARIGVSGVYDGMPQQAMERARVKYGLEERGAFKKAWDKLEKFSLAADLAVRAAIYEQTINETKSPEMPEGDRRLALYRAKEYINFKHGGNSTVIGTLRHMVPFLNAYIQGMDVLYRTMRGKGVSLEDKRTAQKLFLATGIKIAAMSTLYAMLVGDDDDYKGLEGYERDKNYIIPGTGLKIPVAPEVGFMFKVIPERIVQYVVSQGTDRPQDATAFYKGFKDAFIAAYSGTNLTPQLIKPALEVAVNYSFFTGNPIVGMGMKNLDPSLQFTEGTSELAKLFGMVGISPMKADYLIRGYTGMLGAFVLDATDAVANPDRMGKPVNKLPQLSTFMYDTTGRGYKSEFYDFRESVDQVVDTVNMFKREGRMQELQEYLTEDKMKLYAMKGIIHKAEQQLSNLRRYRNIIANDPQMPPDLKREKTDEILAQEKELLIAYNLPKLRGMAGM